MAPEDIPLGIYTDTNFAFALIDPITFRGWAMNDPGPTRTTLSDIAASEVKQDVFFESLVSFIENNGFDGVDLDWEYPVADDRGGKPEDYKNFVNLLMRLRKRLNQMMRPIGLSIKLPASYWHLRGFDIIHLEPHVDFLNTMTYDIRFYGRSFSLESPDCVTAGYEQAAVRVVVFDKDQWVAYDDTATLKSKLDFANRRCLGSTMVWAVNLDDGALIASLEEAMGKKQEFVSDGSPGLIGDLGTTINGSAFP
ncbi:glycoside hydrolase superfamily [Aspergillus venezuelensis]